MEGFGSKVNKQTDLSTVETRSWGFKEQRECQGQAPFPPSLRRILCGYGWDGGARGAQSLLRGAGRSKSPVGIVQNDMGSLASSDLLGGVFSMSCAHIPHLHIANLLLSRGFTFF